MTVALVLAGGLLAVLVPVVLVVFWRRPDAGSRGRRMTWVGFLLMAVFSLLGGLFTAGEALDDPGGATGVRLVLSWLVPLGLLIALAVWSPRWSHWAFGMLTIAVIVAIGWFAIDPAARLIEDRVGPVPAIAAFVIAAALGVFGLKRTRVAGWLLVAVAVFPLAMAVIGRGIGGGQPLMMVSVVSLMTGLLFVIATALITRRAGPDPNQTPPVPVGTGGTTHAADN